MAAFGADGNICPLHHAAIPPWCCHDYLTAPSEAVWHLHVNVCECFTIILLVTSICLPGCCMLMQGDSGFVVIRDKKEIVKSKPLQHYFDCPLQFGAFPEYVEATDTADMADVYSIALKPGDVIIAGESACMPTSIA